MMLSEDRLVRRFQIFYIICIREIRRRRRKQGQGRRKKLEKEEKEEEEKRRAEGREEEYTGASRLLSCSRVADDSGNMTISTLLDELFHRCESPSLRPTRKTVVMDLR